MNQYQEYENLCFVDTLDNVGFDFKGKQADLFGVSAENGLRIKKQNERKISVIIGNPPYNANQASENDNNKNRSYPVIDKRIKDTFIKNSTAQKTKAYDMYSRFYRWAMDRIGDTGVICMITNNSFINTKTYDGFRKCIQDEFDYAYIIDLGGNIKELSGRDGIYLNENHTIFGKAAAVGIAIMFLIKDKTAVSSKCLINYIHPTDIRATRDEKISFLQSNSFSNISFENIQPDKNNNWIHLSNNDFDSLIPIKNELNKSEQLFASSFLGVSTNRDEWVYDFSTKNLSKKMQYSIIELNKLRKKNDKKFPSILKWSDTLKSKFNKINAPAFNEDLIIKSSFRPFTKLNYFTEKYWSDRLTSNHYEVYGKDLKNKNKVICFASYERKPFAIISFDSISNLNYFGDPSNCLPLFRFDNEGNSVCNITDWGLDQFIAHYKNKKITKEEVFNYIYSVLHNPSYRKKYELNLKRDFPRIPFYKSFDKWAKWGKELMDLHINYEAVKPFKLKEITDKEVKNPKVKLKADKETGTITIDEATDLTGIPKEAWLYKLGNRSAIEWVLDQYKEHKPTDPTILEKFNTYKFADYKKEVIDLLMRVTTVSVETMAIINEMEKESK